MSPAPHLPPATPADIAEIGCAIVRHAARLTIVDRLDAATAAQAGALDALEYEAARLKAMVVFQRRALGRLGGAA